MPQLKKLFFYPPAGRGRYENPYSPNFKGAISKYFILLDTGYRESIIAGWSLFKMSFAADVFILNWLENIGFSRFRLLQYSLVCIALKIIKFRRKKIVWMYHNIHPHEGTNFYSRSIQKSLFRNSNIIISHSEEAADYARKHALNEVVYRCHPVTNFLINDTDAIQPCDVFIWGTILPYKGIVEFLSYIRDANINLSIVILGKCNDVELSNAIEDLCSDTVKFYNKRADFNEIASYVKNSRYVLFPYIGDCVSSSGALIDTIVMNGNVLGPDRGAFRDLSKLGVSLVYNSYSDLVEILTSNHYIDDSKRKDFIMNNSWESFANFVCDLIK